MEENERTQVRTVRRGERSEAPAASSRQSGALARGRQMIDELENLFRTAKQMPVIKAHIIPDSAFEDLVGQLRMTLPDMVREAADVLDKRTEILNEAAERAKATREDADRYDRERREAADAFDKQTRSDAENYRVTVYERASGEAQAIIADANTRAAQIVDAANMQAAALVEDNEITRRAKAYAMEISDGAQRHAASMIEEAHRETDRVLSGAAAAFSRNAAELAHLRDTLLSGEAAHEEAAK